MGGHLDKMRLSIAMWFKMRVIFVICRLAFHLFLNIKCLNPSMSYVDLVLQKNGLHFSTSPIYHLPWPAIGQHWTFGLYSRLPKHAP